MPMQFPYSPELMAKVMPDWLVENYKLLEEKLQDAVLMQRGLLISHPREEYDLLEERILESLELRTPRLLKCGHFVAPDDFGEHGEDQENETSIIDNVTGRGSRLSGGTLTAEEVGAWKYPPVEADDEGTCTDCHRHVKTPGTGIGKGARKWDLKIYAANGLMRAGAWSAAWSEMERCDVEICPWIPEDVRKTLDKKAIEQQERETQKQLYKAEVQRRVEEESDRLKKLEDEAEKNRLAEQAELHRKLEDEARQKKLDDAAAAERKQLDDTLNERIEQAKESIRMEFETQALLEADLMAERFRALEEVLKKEHSKEAQPLTLTPNPPSLDDRPRSVSRGRPHSNTRRSHKAEIPLSNLLTNYLRVLATDRKNLVIVIMGALVVFLSMHMNPSTPFSLPNGALPQHTMDLIPSVVVVTTTATAIETSFETITVTQLRQSDGSMQAYVAPSSATIISASSESTATSDEGISLTMPSLESHETPAAPAFENIEVNSISSSATTNFVAVESSVHADKIIPSTLPDFVPVPAVSQPTSSAFLSLVAADSALPRTASPDSKPIEDPIEEQTTSLEPDAHDTVVSVHAEEL